MSARSKPKSRRTGIAVVIDRRAPSSPRKDEADAETETRSVPGHQGGSFSTAPWVHPRSLRRDFGFRA